MRFHLTVFAVVSVLSALPIHSQTLRYEGMCEASAAVALPDGRFAVASDELDELRIYEPGNPIPVLSEDLGRISDLEGAAQIGGTVFWVTSHSLTSTQKDRPNRRKLLATVIGANGLPVEIGRKKDLRSDLADILAEVLPGEAIDDPETSALNIEGLAATFGGGLLLGLRAPLTADRKAVVVRLSRPFEMLGLPQPDTEPLPPLVFTLDLGKRGIRSIEAASEGGYLIVAGASLQDPPAQVPFALYRWDGTGAPVQVVDADLSGLNPEAMIVWSADMVQILSDNGATECSDSDDDTRPRWFPSRMVPY